MKGFLLVQGEVYRYVVVNSHGNTVLFTGVPAREALYHTHGFAVEQFVYATDYRNVSYITVFVYNEAHGNAAFTWSRMYFIRASSPPGNPGICSTMM